MNEQIAKLYEQAIVIEDGGDYVCGELDPVKFAELIVKECAKTAENSFVYWPMDGSLQRTGCARTILGHFGVEE